MSCSRSMLFSLFFVSALLNHCSKCIVITPSGEFNVTLHKRLNVSCKSHGDEQFSWYKDDVKMDITSNSGFITTKQRHDDVIGSVTDSLLWKDNMLMGDAGNYTCRTENRSETASVMVTVVEPPVTVRNLMQSPKGPLWLVAPQSQDILCTVTDLLVYPPRPNWTRQDKAGAPHRINRGTPGYNVSYNCVSGTCVSTLTILEASADKEGQYSCQPEGAGGASESVAVFVLTVSVTNANVTRIVPLSSVELACEPAGKLDGNVTYKWMHNGVEITPQTHPRITVDSKNYNITIKDPKTDDAGEYYCNFTRTGNGFSLSQIISTHLFTPPHVKKLAKSENLAEKDQLDLECRVRSGHPLPTITWYKHDDEGKKVKISEKDDARYVLENGTGEYPTVNSRLIILSLKYTDRAKYVCEATNLLGTASTEIFIRVKDRLAPLWPFLAIVGEVILLCAIMFVCEKKHSKAKSDNEDDEVTQKLQTTETGGETKPKDDVRHRKT